MSASRTVLPSTGLSPRRRGNHLPHPALAAPAGSIPAQAGEPSRRAAPARAMRVYPRAGGGTICRTRHWQPQPGLSPRRRGNHLDAPLRLGPCGSIPAQAGEPATSPCAPGARRVYPRAGGGTRIVFRVHHALTGLSPRRRGNLHVSRHGADHPGSIPAQAGEPRASTTCATQARVYPRAGGGTVAASRFATESVGLSPRRRGNLLLPSR